MKKIVFTVSAIIALTGLWLFSSSQPPDPAPPSPKKSSRPTAHAQTFSRAEQNQEASSEPPAETLLSDEELDAWVQKAGKNPQAVVVEILHQPDAAKRQELLDWVMDIWLTEGRAPVAQWITKYLQEPTAKSGDELLAQFLGGWVQESALEAAQWAQKEVPLSWRKQAEKEVATAWADTAPTSLDQWLDQPEQKALDSFWTEELALGLISVDPALAMKRTEKLASEAALPIQESILQTWLLEDPARAEAWVQKDGRFVTKLQQLRQGLEIVPQLPKP